MTDEIPEVLGDILPDIAPSYRGRIADAFWRAVAEARARDDGIDRAMRAGMRAAFPHAPLPWRLLPAEKAINPYIIADANGRSVADFSPGGPSVTPDVAEGNVALVLRACNRHADLVRVLRELVANPDEPAVWADARALLEKVGP